MQDFIALRNQMEKWTSSHSYPPCRSILFSLANLCSLFISSGPIAKNKQSMTPLIAV